MKLSEEIANITLSDFYYERDQIIIQAQQLEKQNKEFLAIIKELRTRLDKYERGEK